MATLFGWNFLPQTGCNVALQVQAFLHLNLYPFTVANACQQTANRLVAVKTQPNVTIVIAKQVQGGRRQSIVHSVIDPFTSLVWKFQENMLKHFLVGTAMPVTPSSTHHILKNPNYEHPASFGTYIQSLRSVNHPIHRIPKAACPSFASGLGKLINKAICSNSLFDWHRLVCFSFSVLSSRSQRISLTSSVK